MRQSAWWLVAGGLLAACFGIFNAVRAYRHRNEYAEFATLHGWDYLARTFDYSSRFTSAPFGVGTGWHQTDVLRGTLSGLECATFTHHYETGEEAGDK